MTTRRQNRQAAPLRAPTESAPVDPLIGTTIAGKYHIVRLLARGGMGLVYLARWNSREGGEREVVVKVLAPNWIENTEAVARFEREGQRLGEIQHANIVALHDCGHENGVAYMVMEYLAGELLSDYLARKGRLTIEDFIPIAAQVLKGIGFAHSRGLMHRDLKPSNIMLMVRKGRANFVKILDFGMAKLVAGELEVTSEQIVGTASYIAPEQIRGEPLDVRVDVYALGVLFYSMLAGRLPFDGEGNAALLYKHVHEAPQPLLDVLPADHGVPDALIELVHRCLAKSPDDRPVDANEMVEAMIDACPGSMFHLPVADSASLSTSSSGLGDAPTSDLLRTTAYQAVPRDVPKPRPAATARPATGPTLRRGPATMPPSQGFGSTILAIHSPARTRSWGLVAGAAAAVLTGGVLAAAVWAGADPTPVAGGGVSDESRLGAQLDQVEREILEGEFDKARRHLDGMTRDVEVYPALRSRADTSRTRIAIASTLALAQRLENEGNVPAALSAYRDILAIEPHHSVALASITRLTDAMVPAPLPVAPVATVPAAKGGAGKPPRVASGRPERTGAASTPPGPTPASTAEPAPAAGVQEPAPEPAEDPFLPVPKPDDGGIFLPVGGTK